MSRSRSRQENKENAIDPNVAVRTACAEQATTLMIATTTAANEAAAAVAPSAPADDDGHKILRQLPPLLKALFRDCCSPDPSISSASSRHSSSVQGCLRTKTPPPCDQVKSVLPEFRAASPTERSLYATSVASLLVSLKKDATTTMTTSQPQRSSSLHYVSYLFVPVHYLHLLLLVSIEAKQEEVGSAHTRPSDAHSSNRKMIKHVLRCLAGFACSLLEDERANDTSDNTCKASHDADDVDGVSSTDIYLCESAGTTYRAAHLAAFVVESLVRINQHFVRRAPHSLAPLWRSICDVVDAAAASASASSSSSSSTSASGGTVTTAAWSPTVVRRAARALLDHLHEGARYFERTVLPPEGDPRGGNESDRRPEAPTDPDLAFRCKVVDFLLDRLGSFLPHMGANPNVAYDTPSSKSVRHRVADHGGRDSADDLTTTFQILARLRGALSMLPHRGGPNEPTSWSPSLLSMFSELANKLDDLVWSRLCRNDGSRTPLVDVDALGAYLAVRSLEPAEGAVLVVGQAAALIRVLECATDREWLSTGSNCECTLRIIHALMFDAFPRAAACVSCQVTSSAVVPAMVTKLLAAASSCLLMSEATWSCHARSDHGPGKLHQWLLGLLAQVPSATPSSNPGHHPLSYEVALCLLQLHVAGLRRAGFASNHRAFVRLAVLALFDPRTETGFRRRLGRLLVRLVGDGGENFSLVTAVASPCLQSLGRSLGSASGLGKKRKLGNPRARLTPMDLEIVLNAVAALHRDGAMVDKCEAGWDGSVSALGLQVAAIRVTIPTAVAQPSELPVNLPKAFLASYVTAWKQGGRNLSKPAKKSLLVLGVRICDWMHSRCSGFQVVEIDSTEMKEMCETLRLVLRTLSGTDQACDDEAAAAVLSAIQALGTLAPYITPHFPKESLSGIKNSFRELLSSRDWTMRSAALGSMVRFAQTLRKDHGDVLPHCVPESCRMRLGSRLKKGLLVSHQDLAKARSTALLARQLRRCLPTSNSTRVLFSRSASRSTALISAGSFFMTMPTQDGRHAMVIFPPCPDSLKDIRFMLGVEEDEDGVGDSLSQVPAVLKIHGFEPTRNGNCTVMLDEETSI